jgi:hypothetical protein
MRSAVAILVALALALAGAFFSGWFASKSSTQKELQHAIEKADKERRRQEEVLRGAYASASAAWAAALEVNRDRARALERIVRDRPPRLPEPARAACAGASGAELSSPDSGFLIREAARADDAVAALRACEARERAVFSTLSRPSP